MGERPPVLVPTDDQGRPRFSISQFRTYGSSDVVVDAQEVSRGCPRQYRRKYVDKDVPGEVRPLRLAFGSVLHEALHVMERDSTGPLEAMQLVWSPRLPPESFGDAVEVLMRYLDRGGPMTRFVTLDHEMDVTVPLYVDEDFGPVMFRAILDWIGVDPEDQTMLRIVDYKSNQAPPKLSDVRRDMQLKGQDFVVRHPSVWDRFLPGSPARTVVHLDALRYRDVEVRFTPAEIDEWQAWAEAVARKILRDTEWKPSLNDGCSYCPVKHDCPKWLALPGTASTVALRRTGQDPEQVWAQLLELKAAKKLVDLAVDELTGLLEGEARTNGELLVGGQRWFVDDKWANEVDWPALVELLGPRAFDAAMGSKASVERAVKGMDASTRAQALALVRRVRQGTTIKKEEL